MATATRWSLQRCFVGVSHASERIGWMLPRYQRICEAQRQCCSSAIPRLASASSSSSSSNLLQASAISRLSANLAEQHRIPLFRIASDQVSLIEHPAQFYRQLTGIITRARRRIFLASLYIGKSEHDLIGHLSKALDTHPTLQVTILVDGLRSTREGPYHGTSSSESCASLLAALQARHPDRVEIRAYRAPDLPAWLEKFVGKRFVEGWGLQHMKIYGGDDEVMISGANLSNDYFTNRRDRYLVMRDSRISAYMYDLLMTAARFSYSLQSTANATNEVPNHAPYVLEWDEGKRLPMRLATRPAGSRFWKKQMREEVQNLTSAWHDKSADQLAEENVEDAVVIVPMLQMGPIQVGQETACVTEVLRAANEVQGSRLDFTTGYFSLNPLYARWILDGRFQSNMITASPQANGFFGSKGISRHLPAAYTWLTHRFWRRLIARGRQADVTIREWVKPGWTYHAKGIWLYPPHSAKPSLTLLGSSNFGIRSAELDLECTLLVDATHSPALRSRLKEEMDELKRDATDTINDSMFARPERKVHWGVKVAAWCIRRML